jgi:hypothetical protein
MDVRVDYDDWFWLTVTIKDDGLVFVISFG